MEKIYIYIYILVYITKKITHRWLFLTDGIYSDQASDIRIATESAIGERLLKQEGARHGYMEEEGHNKQNKEKKLTKGH